MAKSVGKSYLKLAALPELGSLFLSPVPVVVFDAGLKDILWSNAPGARLFGGEGIADLIQLELPESNSLMFQLRHAAKSLEKGSDAIVRGFRLGSGSRARLLQFELALIKAPKGERLVRVSHLDEVENSGSHEASALDALEGVATAAALIDESGKVLSSSTGYDGLDLSGEAASRLASLVAENRSAYAKGKLKSSAGKSISVKFARLQGEPQRILVLFDKGQSTSFPKEEMEHEEAKGASIHVLSPGHDSAPIASGNTDDTAIDETEDQADLQDGLEPDAAAGVNAENEAGSTHNDKELNDTEQDSEPASGTAAPEISTRFAWSTDSEGRIVSVSDDFARFVGQTYSAIEGKRWSDIAQAYALDTDGEIAHLLSKEDTWSGKTVLWPIGETGTRRAELILAALPAYDNNRSFTGFRGYGKWVADAQGSFDPVNPDIPELEPDAQANEAVASDNQDGISASQDDEPEYNIRLVGDDAEAEVEEYPDNIVAFSSPNRARQELTDGEQRAFRTVKERLSIVGEEENEEEPETIMDGHGLLEKLSVAVLVYRDDEFLFANRNFLVASGYSDLEELSATAGLEDLLQGIDGYGEGSNTSLKRRDGRLVPIKPVLHTVPWKGEKAALLSFAPPVVMPDMSSASPESRIKEIQGILDTTSDGIVLLDQEGKIISFNASAEALFGVEFEEAEGRELPEFFADESREAAEEYVASAMESGPGRLINEGAELIAQEAGGGLIPLFVTINRMEATGKLCAVLRDITTWKRAEEELIQSRRDAERANEQKSEFLAQVSHEIRTPLNAIIGFSDVMIDERFGPVGNERYREYLRDIKRSGTHVLEIVNGLLDLSRIEAGKLELTFEAVDLNELVAETVALLQPQANASRTIIRTSLSRSVPKVVADQRSVRQIILNLVSNAIKYSNNNGQVIVSTVYDSNGEVALRVRDTGDGMSEEQIELAMQPFRQAHEMVSQDASGYGLGLPLTKALVEANRAYFELESEPGEGTIAHVQFPTQRVLNE